MSNSVILSAGEEDQLETIIRRKGCCILVTGVLSPEVMMALAKELGEGAVIDNDVARMASVNFAFGQPEHLSKLRESLADQARSQVEWNYRHHNLSPEAREWLATGHQGRSSVALFRAALGLEPDPKVSGSPNHPYDPADLHRILMMLDAVPEVREKLDVMRPVSPEWNALIDHFDELEALLKQEMEGKEKGMAPQTYERMKAIYAAAEKRPEAKL